MERLDELKALLSMPRKITITCHQKPDADALGSALGLANYFKKKQHDVCVIVPTDYPEFLFWMQGNDQVVIHNEEKPDISAQIFANAELIFCLDFSDLRRVAPLDAYISKAQAPIILIDHHQGKVDFATHELWTPHAAATAELIYDWIALFDDIDLIDKEIGSCLYAGIMTDTGSFKHASTSAKVHRMTAQLIENGVDAARVHRDVYDMNSLDRLRFLGFCLQNRLTLLPQYQTAYFAITDQDLKAYNHKTGDTEGIVNYALSIKGVRMAAFMVERKDCVKISFRSFGDFAVNEFSRKYFGGGGHQNAAGGRVEISLEETVQRFLDVLPKYKDQLNTAQE